MKFQCFAIPSLNPEPHQSELNRFLASHRILAVEKEFASHGQQSYWCFCITYTSGEGEKQPKRPKVDYRELLSPERFNIFCKLRNLRKAIAEQEGIPAYAVFTNEQLAAMTDWDPPTNTKMASLEGVGQARMAKYGRRFLALLTGEPSQNQKPAGGGP